MLYSFTKRNQKKACWRLDLYLDGKYETTVTLDNEKDVALRIEAFISHYPEHDKKFEVSSIKIYKDIYVKGDIL